MAAASCSPPPPASASCHTASEAWLHAASVQQRVRDLLTEPPSTASVSMFASGPGKVSCSASRGGFPDAHATVLTHALHQAVVRDACRPPASLFFAQGGAAPPCWLRATYQRLQHGAGRKAAIHLCGEAMRLSAPDGCPLVVFYLCEHSCARPMIPQLLQGKRSEMRCKLLFTVTLGTVLSLGGLAQAQVPSTNRQGQAPNTSRQAQVPSTDRQARVPNANRGIPQTQQQPGGGVSTGAGPGAPTSADRLVTGSDQVARRGPPPAGASGARVGGDPSSSTQLPNGAIRPGNSGEGSNSR